MPTAELNRFLAELREQRQAPSKNGKRLNMLYGAQVTTRPPRFRITVDDRRLLNLPADTVAVVDKTGAGDAFAGGYLYGVAKKLDTEICAKLGLLAAGEIISHYGTRPETSLAKLAKEKGLLK